MGVNATSCHIPITEALDLKTSLKRAEVRAQLLIPHLRCEIASAGRVCSSAVPGKAVPFCVWVTVGLNCCHLLTPLRCWTPHPVRLLPFGASIDRCCATDIHYISLRCWNAKAMAKAAADRGRTQRVACKQREARNKLAMSCHVDVCFRPMTGHSRASWWQRCHARESRRRCNPQLTAMPVEEIVVTLAFSGQQRGKKRRRGRKLFVWTFNFADA